LSFAELLAEWLACWTQAQKDRVQIAVATLSGLKQTVHTHRASVHQAAKLVAALLTLRSLIEYGLRFTFYKKSRLNTLQYIYVNSVKIVGVHDRSLKEFDLSEMSLEQTFQL